MSLRTSAVKKSSIPVGTSKAASPDGRRKAAILLLALGEEAAAKLCAELDDRDITNLAIGFADLGRLDATEVERLIDDFATHVSLSLAV